MHTRRKNILDILERENEADVSFLAKELHSSEPTIRRDLIQLEKENAIIRTYGGARLAHNSAFINKSFEERSKHMQDEKNRIAEAVLNIIEPEMVIGLDNGTTAWQIATKLSSINPLTVISNSLVITQTLCNFDNITLINIGGMFRRNNLDFAGAQALEAYQSYHMDIFFITCDSLIPDKGLFKKDEVSASIVRTASKLSTKNVLVMDNTKVNAKGFIKALDNNDIDECYIDSGLDAESRNQLKDEPFKIFYV